MLGGGCGGRFAVIAQVSIGNESGGPTRSRSSMVNVPGINLVAAMRATAGSGIRLHKCGGGGRGERAKTAVNQPP